MTKVLVLYYSSTATSRRWPKTFAAPAAKVRSETYVTRAMANISPFR